MNTNNHIESCENERRKQEVFVTKKDSQDVFSRALETAIEGNLKIKCKLKIYNNYLIDDLNEDEFETAIGTILSEKPVDNSYSTDEFEKLSNGKKILSIKLRDEQYDARADAVSQNLTLQTGREHELNVIKTIVFEEDITDEDIEKIKKFLINDADSEVADLSKKNFERKIGKKESFRMFKDINEINIQSNEELEAIINEYKFVFNVDDLRLLLNYFKSENKTPSILEVRLINTYWSDHCRHTTFGTIIENLKVSGVEALVNDFNETDKEFREINGKDETPCLMDIAKASSKFLEKDPNFKGKVNIDYSIEHNAASYEFDLELEDGTTERWIMMFKNETHNSPTQTEPFGGAATCLGGAIRDTLSGRAYTFQCMRISGSSDPRIREDLAHALSQQAISIGASLGYASYGNQIGLATGMVRESFHPGYIAKRFECGYVVGAVNKENLVRVEPEKGDVVLMFGGRTGNDGVDGAATASATLGEFSEQTVKDHVQKGNPVIERKIQRLMLNPEFTKLIKVSNDFGAGGVSVALGELARGITVDLDVVEKHTKYKGLNDEIMTISESQERMAIVIAPENLEKVLAMIEAEDLEGYQVGEVTNDKENSENDRFIINYKGREVVNIKRDFIDTNGAKRYTDAHVEMKEVDYFEKIDEEIQKALNEGNIEKAILLHLQTLKSSSQRGLTGIFDSSVGASTILAPYGGKFQDSPQIGAVSKIPTFSGVDAKTVSISTAAYSPHLLSQNTYIGGMYSVIEAISAMVAMGAKSQDIWFSLQEYFGKVTTEEKWGEVYAALQGTFKVMKKMRNMGIGGKDSMSGTGVDENGNPTDVPPTMVSFANSGTSTSDRIVSAEFKKPGSNVLLFSVKKDLHGLPDLDAYAEMINTIESLIDKGLVLSSSKVGDSGLLTSLSNLSLGNRIGFEIDDNFDKNKLFYPCLGDIVLEIATENCKGLEEYVIGKTTKDEAANIGNTKISIEKIKATLEGTLEEVWSTKQLGGKVDPINRYREGVKIITEGVEEKYKKILNGDFKEEMGGLIEAGDINTARKSGKPIAILPVFSGTNSELDTRNQLIEAGFYVVEHIFYSPKLGLEENLKENELAEKSRKDFADMLEYADLMVFPGGFSGGDEPDGSAKYIANMMRSKEIRESFQAFLDDKTKLTLGICNGFQALIKLGLFENGKINDMLGENDPTLTYNDNNRHITGHAGVQVVSNLTSLIGRVNIDDVFWIPVSHGEGRVFIPDQRTLDEYIANGQVVLQYVDEEGNPTNKYNGSESGIAALCDPYGTIMGLMPHPERIGLNVAKNVPGEHDMQIFKSANAFFKCMKRQDEINELKRKIDKGLN